MCSTASFATLQYYQQFPKSVNISKTAEILILDILKAYFFLVCLVDRILKLLDENTDRSALIMTTLDWSAAFDRQDPTIAIKKCIQLGFSPSVIPLLSCKQAYAKLQMITKLNYVGVKIEDLLDIYGCCD